MTNANALTDIAAPHADREALLASAAREAAQKWANAYREELARDGRPVEGGWPGTMPEARARGAACAGRHLVERAMSVLTYAELGRVARITYDEARRCWRSVAVAG